MKFPTTRGFLSGIPKGFVKGIMWPFTKLFSYKWGRLTFFLVSGIYFAAQAAFSDYGVQAWNLLYSIDALVFGFLAGSEYWDRSFYKPIVKANDTLSKIATEEIRRLNEIIEDQRKLILSRED